MPIGPLKRLTDPLLLVLSVVGIYLAYTAGKGLIEQVPKATGFISEFIGGFGEGIKTQFCNYANPLGLNPLCKEEAVIKECYRGQMVGGVCVETGAAPTVVVRPETVIVQADPICNPLDSCRATGQQLQQCYTTSIRQVDVKGNVECVCSYDQQCENHAHQLECESQTGKYWSLDQCKDKPTAETIDAVTGEKVQDILDDIYVAGGGNLQQCKNQKGIVVGQYFAFGQKDAVTTCVPKIEKVDLPTITAGSIASECQRFCNTEDLGDIGSIDKVGNYCKCDNVPQVHLASLMNTTIEEIDNALR